MTRYRLAMFDFDGTLADSFGWFARTLPQLAPRYRLNRLDAAELQALRGLDARTILRRLGVSWWKLPPLSREMRRRMREEIDGIAPFAGIDDLFAALREAGIDIAIVTSNSEENVRCVLGDALLGHVRALSGGVSIFGKRAKLAAAMKHCGASPDATVYVGDEIRDAEAAAALGIDFLGVAWGYTTPEALARACRHPPCADVPALRNALLAPMLPRR
jgi:phosphoglycolate phosphatase